MMRFISTPRLHGVLLVAAGAVAGSLGTLALQHWLGPEAKSPQAPAEWKAENRGNSPKRNPESYRVRAEQIAAADDPEHRSGDLRRLGTEAAAEDETEALKLAAGIKGNADRIDFTLGVVESMASRDPKAAAEFALSQMGKGSLQAESLRIALGKWGAGQPRDAYEWAAEHLNGPLKEEAINSVVSNWAARSPEAAARWFEQTGSTSQPLLASLLTGWARTPEEARAAAGWVDQLPAAENRSAGQAIVAGILADQDPATAVAMYQNPTPEVAGVIADRWGASDPAAAARWIQQLPAGQGREQAAGTLATIWAASDIEAAAAWSASLGDPEIRAAAVEHVATTWGAIDPDKAVAWVGTQPPELRGRGLAGAYNSWAGTDAPGLAEWITQLPAGEQADMARRSLAEVKLAEDPAAALGLTMGMSPAAQPDAAGRYFRAWRRSDDAAAQEWLQTNWSALAEATQARLAKEQLR